ncbi:hypothetical protein [Xanthomonas nasturtii]|uniref:Uncharacterized protein n=1 Tax=Xanthomonas nasturtii TaxID=1843581 RepID=A0ABT0LVN2_9XANT|nr:hypothetical protein [Xanthomonas nasturtii]MCL1553390.1 hypothetical protein [Xanthomonas nasturtii]MCL1555550.1 hypothetical protein [Xanthomonas nasturtii]
MSLTRDALQTHLDPVDAAGGKHWWLVDQAVAMLGRGRQLANKYASNTRSIWMVATA